MASFTDNIQALSTFTPYVQQLPVEAMVKVGMQKQEQYNQGVQKIQTAIDNIAGLDIAKDADKAYLQSKINELGNNLKFVAAGDFSDFQLVNSVNGMTGQLVKDPNVQNAVSSTAIHRKNVSIMEKDRQDGKLAPENETDYMNRFSSYINSDKVGEKFSGQYTPYIDVNKKLLDIGKEVGLDENTIQQLYQTDDKGNVLRDANGVPKWNPVMVEKHLKGKDANKILTAFKNALTPADYNQLAITGRYVKSGTSIEGLTEEVVNNYDSDIKTADGKIQSIGIELYKQSQKNEKDENLIKSLSEQKEFFEKQKESLVTSRDKDLANLAENPDSVRASLYTNNYLSKMSTSLSSMTEETKYSVSPLFDITMRQNEFNRQLQRDKIADYHWSKEQEREDRKELYGSQKDQLELFLKYGVGTPPPGYKGTKGIDEPISIPDDKFAIVNAVRDDFENGTAELNQKNYQITLQYFKEVNPQKTGESNEKYEDRLKKAMSYYAKANKESIDPNSGGINTFTARFAAKQMQEWKTDPDSVPYEFRGLISSQYKLTQDLSLQQKRMAKIKEDAIKQAKEQGLDIPSEKEIKKNIKGASVNINNKTINLSSQDIIDLADLRPGAFDGRFAASNTEQIKTKRAKDRLLLKYGNNLKAIEDYVYNVNKSPMYTPIGKLLGTSPQMLPELEKAGDFLYNYNYKKLAEIEAKLYVDKGFVKQPKSFPLQRGTENKDDVNARVASIISQYPSNLNEEEGFNTEEMIAAAVSDKSGAVKLTATPGISSREPVSYTMTVIGADGKSRKMKISETDFTYLSKQPGYTNQETPQVVQQLNFYGTTGMDGTNNPDAAWFSSSSFKNLKGSKYKVTANYVEDKNNPNLLYFRMFVHQPDGSVKPITYNKPISKLNTDGSFNQALDILPEAIYPSTIDQLLKNK